ncbi:MAG TPA: hypothetical protein VGL04_01170 [Sporichthyaceae bacterium]
MNRRRAGAVLASAFVWSALSAGPAFALHRDDGDDPGKQISKLKAILVYGVTPISIMIIIALLVMLPSLARGPRYRLGEEWRANPEWFGAPGAEVEAGGYGHGHAAVEAPAEPAELTGRIVATGAEETGEDGGSSARW